MNLKLSIKILAAVLITVPSFAQMTVEQVYECIDKLENDNPIRYSQLKSDGDTAFSYIGNVLTTDEVDKMELSLAQKSNTCEEAFANADAKHKLIIQTIEKLKSDLLK